MTRVVEIPASFDDRSFDTFAAQLAPWPPEERVLFDARPVQWVSPLPASSATQLLVPTGSVSSGRHASMLHLIACTQR